MPPRKSLPPVVSSPLPSPTISPHQELLALQAGCRKFLSAPKLFAGALESADQIKCLLRQAMAGESVSALLLGPPGSGKSVALKSAVSDLEKEGAQIITVKLFGNQYSDDRQCMRDLFGQLVSRMQRDAAEARAVTRRGTLSTWIAKLAQLLRESCIAGFLVFVVLEGFDGFCYCRQKQALLYNLFDLMQQPEVRLVCLGVSRKLDVTDRLEKRIKSRFQLRKIYCRSARNFSELLEIVNGVFSDVSSVTLQETIGSKTLEDAWTLYFDLGFSIRDFVYAVIRAILKARSILELPALLTGCMFAYESAIDTEAGTAALLSGLTISDHIVLVSLARLHKKGFRPKSFASVYREIISFEKSGAGQVLVHSRNIYWRSFLKLRALGIISVTESSATEALPLAYCACRLNVLDLYSSFFYESTQAIKDQVKSIERNPLDCLPSAILDWATKGDLMNL